MLLLTTAERTLFLEVLLLRFVVLFVVFVFEIGSYYAALAGLELTM